ncbi:transporter substrate-binding domain-containing protein [Pseudodesulfovibrio sp.]|uniref:substrate-binding periplasmic protein n=1 Tax=Pseudodesulfovibrio sp. TaxID=2035812 RepID=UPI0026323923|nr:transporter substrate-binding domain-containing protein [Pseudodesulfovibrio sp.]MDD3310732.1 transporter substrate-binding domain-containing protein [Pseudodesulfovibrio sp.]
MVLSCRHTPLLLALCLAALAASFGRPAQAGPFENLSYLSEEYYPFTHNDHGEVQGISVDLLRRVWARLGVQEQPIDVLPWARAYELARLQPGTMLFSMARTPERESLFRWAGPILEVRFMLFAKKDRKIRIENFSQLAGRSVGIVRGDVAHTILEAKSPACILDAVSDMRQNVRKLMENRLDMVAYEEHAWPSLIRRIGLDPAQFETVFLLRETPVYFAFHRDVPQPVVAQFQQALDAVRASPDFGAILRTYFR